MEQYPRTARSVDAITLLIVLCMLSVLSGPVMGAVLPTLIVLAPLFVVGYVFSAMVTPLFESRATDDPEIAGAIGDPTIRLRISKKQSTRAIDLIFRKYIIINDSDLNGYFQDWRALVHHEHCHLTTGDARYFHFLAISALSLLAGFAMFLIGIGIDIADWFQGRADQPLRAEVIGYNIGVLGLIAFFYFWIRRSLHHREFIADAAAWAREPDAVTSWLRRALKQEKDTSLQWGAPLVLILANLTHPSFAKRSRAIENLETGGGRLEPLLPGILGSIVFFWVAGTLLFGSWQNCVFRAHPDTDSDFVRTSIPIASGHDSGVSGQGYLG